MQCPIAGSHYRLDPFPRGYFAVSMGLLRATGNRNYRGKRNSVSHFDFSKLKKKERKKRKRGKMYDDRVIQRCGVHSS